MRKVKIVSREELLKNKNQREDGIEFLDGMLDFAGKVIEMGTIKSNFGNYQSKNFWYWHPSWFNEISEFHMKEIDV